MHAKKFRAFYKRIARVNQLCFRLTNGRSDISTFVNTFVAGKKIHCNDKSLLASPTRASNRVEMPNGTGNFWKFQISGKWDNLERLTKISEIDFSKITFPFDFEPEFPEILVEWIAPVNSVFDVDMLCTWSLIRPLLSSIFKYS